MAIETLTIAGLPTALTQAQCTALKKQLIKLQGGRCAICEARFVDVGGYPCLDHDHSTGLIRGVLCANCNGMEGKIYNRANRAKRSKTIKEWLQSLLEYWDYHKENPSKHIYYMHGKKAAKRTTKSTTKTTKPRSKK